MSKDPKASYRKMGRKWILCTISGYYERIEKIAENKFIEKFRAEDQKPLVAEQEPLELNTKALMEKIRNLPIVNVIGFGSKNQFASLEDMKAAAKIFVNRWNNMFHGQWLIAYRGDSANPEKPDIGLLVRHIHDYYGIPVLAIQSDIVKYQWGGVDKWIDFVHYVATDKSTNAEGKETILWGGVNKAGQTVGASQVMFDRSSPLFRESLSAGIVGLGIFGGGEISKSELTLAEKLELKIDYYPLLAKNPNPGHPLGEVFESAERYAAFERMVRSCKNLFN